MDFKESLHSLSVTEIFNGGCDLPGITDVVINNDETAFMTLLAQFSIFITFYNNTL